MKNGRVILFYAPCGFGKSTVSKALLKGEASVFEASADMLDIERLENERKKVIVIDNLQLLNNQEEQHRLCAAIREHTEKRFVFLSRGLPPGWLIPFQLSGLMLTVDSNELFFNRNGIISYFSGCGIKLSEMTAEALLKDCMGYPLALSIIARRMKSGEEYGEKLLKEVTREIFLYYEEVVYRRFELPMRRFLLDLAPFEEFGTELAKIASGDSRAGEYLDTIQKNSNMMLMDGLDKFHFWEIFRQFLLWEQKKEYTEEEQRALFSRGGLYYELHENYGKALEFYSKSAEVGKISELLIKNTALHPGMGHYEEMAEYFFSLSDERIKTSPALMQGMSMLCALRVDYENSEKWYRELKLFADSRDKSDAAAKEARSRLVFLDISLPQRGVSSLLKIIPPAFKMLMNKEIQLPAFSVTSTLPSIMNGGKDFSLWSKKDDLLYATMRIPVEAILGRDGVGLADCAVAESKFEKGEDIASRMLTLVSKLNEVQIKGTPDIEFALVGLLARSQADAGRAEDAYRTIAALRERFCEKGLVRFLANIDAFLCRISLCLGDMLYVDEWYRDKAPRNTVALKTMKRYQYMTQAMAELARGDNDAVLLTLAPLEPYYEACGRHIDMIHLKTLSAMAKYRGKKSGWKEDLEAAIDIAAEYNFVRTISAYGAAVLPMLGELEKTKHKKFMERLVKAARNRAVYYPDFLKPEYQLTEPLTDAEMQVLRLLCADKSNAEIGEMLNIKLATVKSHVSHILQKLDVSRRAEAKTAAQKMKLI